MDHLAGSWDAESNPDKLNETDGLPAAVSPSPMADWLPILRSLSIDEEEARRVDARARLAGVCFQTELLSSGLVSERTLFLALAKHMGLAFVAHPDPDALVMRERQGLAALARRGGARVSLIVDERGQSIVLIAPDRLNIPALRSFVERYPRASTRIRVVQPTVLRDAISVRSQKALMRIATERLFTIAPEMSARIVANAWQGAVLGAATVTLAFAALFAPSATLLALHMLFSLAFLACVLLRVMVRLGGRVSTEPRMTTVRPAEMPVYSVLIALYKEAEIVPDLLVALSRIVWPRAKLEIKLVCEQDDEETLAALRAQELRPYIEVIEVPPGVPRTKPKALSYALPMTSGAFVALYDAEDRPHPFQLVEAWHAFRGADEGLACVQAPLTISNRRESWISAMFALEYAALFRAVLPWLARRGLLLPLGGTSNHFRRSALEAVGGWDPYNVTEDADLGARLHRYGYRADVICNPTQEDAPTDIRTWVPQRTRWFKGWVQTWLVHMRDPAATAREIGLLSFIVMQVLFAGMVFSALAYSVFWATALGIGIHWYLGGEFRPTESILLLVDVLNVALGHVAFLLLGWSALQKTEKPGFWKCILWTPAYWCLMSIAAWRCVWQLYWNPHHWEKTPHKRRNRVRVSLQKTGT
ncbi:glycosyltransferase [Nitratireductor rhodophyticola]|uniref:glycosyltransferase n=1 Tax=Nitratireductor rhodophyticola TaxID=2854036 RepID=UPI002AC94228|nr:glycosyltransferase [Nitratireductor rhodophyticola]WPZ14853.1 glycosyltransferase [Nitratireductor rhodophyticola]